MSFKDPEKEELRQRLINQCKRISEPSKQTLRLIRQVVQTINFPKKPSKSLLSPEIKARVYSDDRVIEVEFDAARWFAQASEEAIDSLFASGLRSDYPADRVADDTATWDADVQAVFDYVLARSDSNEAIGFECHVDRPSAVEWMRLHRPVLLQRIFDYEEAEK